MKNQPGVEENTEYRKEHDSLGEVLVPRNALYGAQTQRAIENFSISGIRFPREAIEAIATIKSAAAYVNGQLELLDTEQAQYTQRAADEVATGAYNDQFPLDVFMTGSGTSFNMNANEVIATLAQRLAAEEGSTLAVHPNDHVNMGQSSNDVIPSTIHLAALFLLSRGLLPALQEFEEALREKSRETEGLVKTGRTHLMDAVPIFLSDELNGWAHQANETRSVLERDMPALGRIALGGTAVGTGLNAHPQFGALVSERLRELTGLPIAETSNHFALQSSMDTMVRLSGELKVFASALMKIADDIRWMNSGPNAGLHEISLPPLQPGSSIMPGKVNPVLCEAAMQVCVQVIANDAAVTIGNSRGNFQLNLMLPLIGHNVWQSLHLLTNSLRKLTETTIVPFTVNEHVLQANLERNPIVVTTLVPTVGYEKAATIAKRAYEERRPVIDVAAEETGMDPDTLRTLLNSGLLARGNKNGDIT